MELTFTPEAIEAIAEKTIKRRTGARGLRAIMEGVMQELMFRIPSDEKIATCTITKEAVEGTAEPELTSPRGCAWQEKTPPWRCGRD